MGRRQIVLFWVQFYEEFYNTIIVSRPLIINQRQPRFAFHRKGAFTETDAMEQPLLSALYSLISPSALSDLISQLLLYSRVLGNILYRVAGQVGWAESGTRNRV